VTRQRRHFETGRERLPGNHAIVHSLGQPANDVQTRVGPVDVQQPTQVAAGQVEQSCLTLRIECAHAPDVPRQMTILNELGEHSLVERWALPIPQRASVRKCVDQDGRHDQVAQPEGRKEHLAERAEVYHPAIGIQALQRRERSAGVAVLAVIVVFENPGVLASCPFEQRTAARQGHDHAQWVLT